MCSQALEQSCCFSYGCPQCSDFCGQTICFDQELEFFEHIDRVMHKHAKEPFVPHCDDIDFRTFLRRVSFKNSPSLLRTTKANAIADVYDLWVNGHDMPPWAEVRPLQRPVEKTPNSEPPKGMQASSKPVNAGCSAEAVGAGGMVDMSSWNHFEVLGVDWSASPEQLRIAWKAAALKHHPDKNIGNEKLAARNFVRVQAAAECLLDDRRRAKYLARKQKK